MFNIVGQQFSDKNKIFFIIFRQTKS